MKYLNKNLWMGLLYRTRGRVMTVLGAVLNSEKILENASLTYDKAIEYMIKFRDEMYFK